jgi:rhamnosyltransferase subunit B
MRILITTLGSSGDINPFIAIARALLSRGHHPLLLVNPHYRAQIQDAGIAFAPLGDDWDLRNLADFPDLMHPRRGPIAVINGFVAPLVPQIVARTRETIREFKPDAAVTHPICFGASWVYDEVGLPYATAVPQPATWFSAHDRTVLVPSLGDNPPLWLHRLILALARPALRRLFDKPFNRIRRDLGFPPIRDLLLTEFRGGTINLGLWSPHFRPAMPDDPPGSVITGFPWHDRRADQEHAPEAIHSFLQAGPPPILFTLGSAAVHVAGDFYYQAAEACRLLNRRGLLLTARPEYAPPAHSLPPAIRPFTYAPYSAVMPRVAASVHHGGIGTTGQALRAGRPMVVIPHAHDQFDNAARVKRLGVAAVVPRTRLTPQRLAAALRAVLYPPGPAAAATNFARVIAAEDGAATAATAIERLGTTPAIVVLRQATQRADLQ